MTHRIHTRIRLGAMTLAVALAGSASPLADAAILSWNGSSNANWTTAANWTDGAAADADDLPDADDVATFHDIGAGNLTTSLNGVAWTIDGLAFNANAVGSVVIGGLSPSVRLTLDGGAATDISVAAGTHTIQGTNPGGGAGNQELVLQNTQVWDAAAGATLNIAARIIHSSTSQTFTKTGDGTVILSANNGGSGGWNISVGTGFAVSNGVLQIADSGATGNSANDYTVASGATLQLNNANYGSNNGDLTLNGTGESNLGALNNLAGNNSIAAGTGQVLLATTSDIRVTAGSLTIAQDINGAGGLTKRGTGVLTLTATNGYVGTTTIGTGGGTLLVNGTHTTGGNYGTLSGSNALGGVGVIGGTGSVTIVSASTLMPGAALNTIGSLTISKDLILNGTFEVDVLGASIDQVLGIDDLTLGGTSVLDIVGTLTEMSYTIMTYTNRIGASTFGDISDAVAQGYTVVYDDSLGQVRLLSLVPAPAALPAGLVAMGLIALRRRSRR